MRRLNIGDAVVSWDSIMERWVTGRVTVVYPSTGAVDIIDTRGRKFYAQLWRWA